MSGLVDQYGRPLSSSQTVTTSSVRQFNKKAEPPKLGPAFGNWSGRHNEMTRELPGGGLVQFNLNNLELSDYRTMRDHYQVNSSLSVLSFMQHQSDWSITGSTDAINKACEEQLRGVWTQLNRGLSQANWAGYSPNVLEWENDVISNSVVLNKVKDLIPEECAVQWEDVDMWAPPGIIPAKTKIFNGIRQLGTKYPIPIGNAFWYPMLMENGNYGGRHLLRPAFTSYFFSHLMHLFANRYYERFGEPVPIGRAPFDDNVDVGVNSDGSPNIMRSTDYMLGVLQNLRNRSVVVLPADRSQDEAGRGYFDYDISYLESQMRGADFERYMERLDQEISLALFTPILLMNVADVGSYNLGQGHQQMYFYMLNAMNADRAFYIDRYILSPMTDINFSKLAPRPHITFRPLGNNNPQMVQAIITALIQNSLAKPDLKELGVMAGMTINEIQQTVEPPTDPGSQAETDGTKKNDSVAKKADPSNLGKLEKPIKVCSAISDRVKRQVDKAFRQGKFNDQFDVVFGYKQQFYMALDESGFYNARDITDEFYDHLTMWHKDMVSLGTSFNANANEYMSRFDNELGYKLSEYADSK